MAVAAPSLDDVHITGVGIVLHFDGQVWNVTRRGDPDFMPWYRTIWAGPDSFLVLPWSFDSFSRIENSHGEDYSNTWMTFRSIWASSLDDIYVVGNDHPSWPLILHYDGVEWTSHAAESGEGYHGYRAVWGSGPEHVLVSSSTGLLRKEGDGWTVVREGSFELVWTAGPSTIVVTTPAGIEHFDGNGWTVHELPGEDTINALWGYAPNRIWAVGSSGMILHFDGQKWLTQVSGTTAELRDVRGVDGGPVFAVGPGTILWNNGDGWSPLACDQA